MHTLNEDFEIAGEWWLPDKREAKEVVSGILHFSTKGIDLHVNQAFNPLTGSVRPGDPNPKYPAVHGVTVKGEAVTLFGAQQLGTSINFGSGGLIQAGKINAHALAFGAHLPPNFTFSKVSFRVPNLAVWLGQKVISHEISFDAEKKLAGQSFCLGRMPNESFLITDLDARLSLHYGWNSKADAYNSIRVDVSAWFSLMPSEAQPIDWFIEQQTKFLTLLSLLSGYVFVADSIQARLDESNHRADILIAGPRPKPKMFNQPADFFLSKPTLSNSFEEICNNWFEVFPKIERPASLARSILASEDLWLHVEFISLMQALEGLHRVLYDGVYMDETKYAKVRAALTSAIPRNIHSAHKDALKSRIKYGNQISLRKRLGDLSNNLSPTTKVNVFGLDNGVPPTWIDTRNYYTHWDDELLSNVLDAQSMYYANERMKHLIRVLYAQLVGVGDEDIERAFKNISRLSQQLVEINIVQKRQANPEYRPQAIMTISSQEAPDSNESSDGDSCEAESE